jgi:hypothetical protein
MSGAAGSKPRRTASERWFEEYAREAGLGGWEDHEPDLGIEARPDYLVHALEAPSARAVCEVKEFTTSGLERRLRERHSGTLTLSDKEVYGAIRGRVRQAAKQLKPLAGRGLPLVIVLANPNGVRMEFDANAVELALYGNYTYGGPVNPATGAVEQFGRLPGRDGKLTMDHSYVSAVVLLRRRFHARDHDEAWWKAKADELRPHYPDRPALMNALLEAAQDKPDGPPGHYHYVEVLHTVSSMQGEAVPLPAELLAGIRDKHYEPDARGFYSRVR